jgi:hypothetical protein
MNGVPASSRRLLAAGLVVVAALALLALAATLNAPQNLSASAPAGASRDCSTSDLGAGATLSSALEAPVRLGPAHPGAGASTATLTSDAFAPIAPPPGAERRSDLLNARIQEKYRPFQQSLRTP